MADEDDEEHDEDDEGGVGGGGNKKLLIIVGLALFLVVGAAAAAYFTGLLQPVIEMITGGGGEEVAEGGKEGTDIDISSVESAFKDLPDLIVNLNTGGKKAVFLNMKVSLELTSNSDKDKVDVLIPRITDYFQVYLRELRVEDLEGSAGMYRLREELLARVRLAVTPIKVRDVLFKQILIQ